ncbi:MAG: NUDIX hydrolase [Pseudomonadales bacterium]
MNTNNVHLTVATVVERAGRFLMVRETDKGREVINQPAGHWEIGETLAEAALRETLEETAWTVELTAFLGLFLSTNSSGESYCRVAFSATPLNHHPNLALDPDIIQAEWLSREELLAEHDKMRSQLVIHTLDEYLSGRHFDLSAVAAIPLSQ